MGFSFVGSSSTNVRSWFSVLGCRLATGIFAGQRSDEPVFRMPVRAVKSISTRFIAASPDRKPDLGVFVTEWSDWSN